MALIHYLFDFLDIQSLKWKLAFYTISTLNSQYDIFLNEKFIQIVIIKIRILISSNYNFFQYL